MKFSKEPVIYSVQERVGLDIPVTEFKEINTFDNLKNATGYIYFEMMRLIGDKWHAGIAHVYDMVDNDPDCVQADETSLLMRYESARRSIVSVTRNYNSVHHLRAVEKRV